MTYVEVKQRLDEWYDGNDVDISPEVLDCCYSAIRKQVPMKIIIDGNDESDWAHCPCCNEILGVNESVYNAFCENNWEPIYCYKCGQSLIFE